MRIIICGAGRVGYGIAERLAVEANDVTVIDQSPELVQTIAERLDVRGILGHGAHPEVLEQAGAREADMVIAVTFSDEVNMVACQVCHSLFSVPTKIARVRSQSYLDPQWQDLFSRKHMPIDVIISPEREVAESILRRLRNPGAFETISFVDGRVSGIGVRLPEDCPVVNTPLNQLTELFPDLNATIVGVLRDGNLFRPRSTDQLVSGDSVYFVADRNHVARTLDIFGHSEKEARRLIIIGAGNIGRYVARELEASSGYKVRIVEIDRKRAEEAAQELPRAIVLHGDALDKELLREAGAGNAQAVLALSNDDQVNILSTVIARREGAERVVALINNADYAGLVDAVGIDAFIDPRATTISTVLQHVRRGRIKGVYSVQEGAAEFLDAVALETSPLVGKPLRDTNLPDGVSVGAVVRDGDIMTPEGDTMIEPGDRVVLFALRKDVKAVEQMFRVSLEYF